MTAKPLPAVHRSAIPSLIVRGAAHAIEFYKTAFGATEVMRLTDPSSRLVHAEIMIGDALIMLADEIPEWGNLAPESIGGSPVHIHLYVDDVDAIADRAIGAGAKLLFPVADQFYGDRGGRLQDPFGHIWGIATHTEDVPVAEMQKRFDVLMAKQPGGSWSVDQ